MRLRLWLRLLRRRLLVAILLLLAVAPISKASRLDDLTRLLMRQTAELDP